MRRDQVTQDLPGRFDVFGTSVSLTTVEGVSQLLVNPGNRVSVVAIANVHSVMTARRLPPLRRFLEEADVVTPDGMPLVWALKVDGQANAVRVTGIDVLAATLSNGRRHGIGHFFYGSTEEVVSRMVSIAQSRYPGVVISGSIAPPFGGIGEDELRNHCEQIGDSGAKIVWVGLGMPKQELWIAEAQKALPDVSFVGIGAAFDWFAELVSAAPEWMKKRGLEWLYRLIGNPRRMWRRYAYNNPAFLALLGRRWVKTRLRGRWDMPSS